jgi:hypothetical protein
VAHSPAYLHPFACFVCRRSFKRPAVDRDEAACPVCGNPAIALSRKFKPPRQGDIKQWAKVETLVRLGFRFDTIHDGAGGTVRYPATERGIPAFVQRVAALNVQETGGRRSEAESKRRRTRSRQKRRVTKARHSSE